MSHARPVIALPSGAAVSRSRQERKLEQREMYLLLQQEIADRFYWGETSLGELARETEQPGGWSRAEHELRYYTISISERGVVGQVSPLHFATHQVGIPINAIRNQLRDEQPGCDWWVVAWQIEVRNVAKPAEAWSDNVVDARALESAANGGRVFGQQNPNVRREDFANQDPDDTTPVNAGPSARIVEEPDYQVVVHLAWADVRKGRLQDSVTHLHQRYGRDGVEASFMRDYAKSRNIDMLPEGSRMNRQLAKAVMQFFDTEQKKLTAEAVRIGATDEPPEPAPVRKVAPATAAKAVPMMAAPARRQGELTDAVRARILELRSKGSTPASIAKSTRVKMDKVIEVLSAAAGSQD